MPLFGKREVKPPLELANLEAEVARIASVVRQLELEQSTMHDQVRKWMRRAIAAERVVERAHADKEPSPAATPASPDLRGMRGVRARRLARILRNPLPDPSELGGSNGVH